MKTIEEIEKTYNAAWEAFIKARDARDVAEGVCQVAYEIAVTAAQAHHDARKGGAK